MLGCNVRRSKQADLNTHLTLFHIQQIFENVYSKIWGKKPIVVGIITGKKVKLVAKGASARLEQFLILSQCFQKLSATDVSKFVYMRERVK